MIHLTNHMYLMPYYLKNRFNSEVLLSVRFFLLKMKALAISQFNTVSFEWHKLLLRSKWMRSIFNVNKICQTNSFYAHFYNVQHKDLFHCSLQCVQRIKDFHKNNFFSILKVSSSVEVIWRYLLYTQLVVQLFHFTYQYIWYFRIKNFSPFFFFEKRKSLDSKQRSSCLD